MRGRGGCPRAASTIIWAAASRATRSTPMACAALRKMLYDQAPAPRDLREPAAMGGEFADRGRESSARQWRSSSASSRMPRAAFGHLSTPIARAKRASSTSGRRRSSAATLAEPMRWCSRTRTASPDAGKLRACEPACCPRVTPRSSAAEEAQLSELRAKLLVERAKRIRPGAPITSGRAETWLARRPARAGRWRATPTPMRWRARQRNVPPTDPVSDAGRDPLRSLRPAASRGARELSSSAASCAGSRATTRWSHARKLPAAVTPTRARTPAHRLGRGSRGAAPASRRRTCLFALAIGRREMTQAARGIRSSRSRNATVPRMNSRPRSANSRPSRRARVDPEELRLV